MQGRVIQTIENEFTTYLDGNLFGSGMYTIVAYSINGEKSTTRWIVE